ncbi:hypothetical protein ACHAW5_004876 [Stephanodiscus triporus]|uniref:Uncharacterized protein n=1 Tax=Stephanodiscus triporus TaxID=2934178 RepID=A0ABD3P566_9STRA
MLGVTTLPLHPVVFILTLRGQRKPTYAVEPPSSWELAWTLSGSCTGSLSPTPEPTSLPTPAPTPEPTAVDPVPTPLPTHALWASGGCPEAYALNAQVAPGASVSVTTDGVSLVYTCTTDAYSPFCSQAGYEPGTGIHWELAWTLSGSCTGTSLPRKSYQLIAEPGGMSQLVDNER